MSAAPNATPTAEDHLTDEGASSWLMTTLKSALERDPIDALNDALVLAEVLDARLRKELGLQDPSQRGVTREGRIERARRANSCRGHFAEPDCLRVSAGRGRREDLPRGRRGRPTLAVPMRRAAYRSCLEIQLAASYDEAPFGMSRST